VRVGFDGVTLFGFSDWDHREHALFGDWKTTGNPSHPKWGALSPVQLAGNVQFLVYSEAFLQEWPEHDRVTGRWCYASTGTVPRAYDAVEAVAARAPRRLAVLQKGLDSIRQIHDSYTEANAVAPTRGAHCNYCDYAALCHQGNSMSNFDLDGLISQIKNGSVPAAAPPAATPPPAAASPGADPNVVAALASNPAALAAYMGQFKAAPAPAHDPAAPLADPVAALLAGTGGAPEAGKQTAALAAEIGATAAVPPPEEGAKRGRGKATTIKAEKGTTITITISVE
jgi:hypothetical protein